MELFINAIFYNNSCLLYFDNFPIKFYIYMYLIALIFNIIQPALLLFYFVNNYYYNSLINFTIITLINILLIVVYLIKIDTVYNSEFGFLHKAMKINKSISIKPFNNIIRMKCSETIPGLMYFIFSFLKCMYTLYSSFIFNASNLYNNNNNQNTNDSINNNEYLITKHLFYIFFDFYYLISYYTFIYLQFICFIYLLIKLTYVFLSLNFKFTLFLFKIMRCKKIKSRIDDLKDSFFHNLIGYSEKIMENAKESTDNLPLISYYSSYKKSIDESNNIKINASSVNNKKNQ